MKILVGISGGVDSAYTALRLIREGHSVEGAVLKMHEHTDVISARKAAEELNIPLHEIDATVPFNNIIKKNLVSEYLEGRTPNPCILCNERVKFAALYDFAEANGFDKIATGHYARVVSARDRYAVASAADAKKDQSYMLYRLSQKILSKLLLPLSEEDKSNVRRDAGEAGVSASEKKDSQEICFLPDLSYVDYIESLVGKTPEGDFVSPDGQILGRHKGIIRYTVGQRKGLGISLGERVFVTDISPESNTVTLSPKMIGKKEIEITDVVYSGLDEKSELTPLKLTAKLRYTAPKIPVTVRRTKSGNVLLNFDSEVIAAPGQSAVIYDGDTVMLGGYISK